MLWFLLRPNCSCNDLNGKGLQTQSAGWLEHRGAQSAGCLPLPQLHLLLSSHNLCLLPCCIHSIQESSLFLLSEVINTPGVNQRGGIQPASAGRPKRWDLITFPSLDDHGRLWSNRQDPGGQECYFVLIWGAFLGPWTDGVWALTVFCAVWFPFLDPTHPCVAICKLHLSQGRIESIFLHTSKCRCLHLTEAPSAPLISHKREMAAVKAIPRPILGACLKRSQMTDWASKGKRTSSSLTWVPVPFVRSWATALLKFHSASCA